MEILLKQRTKQRRVRFSGTQVSQEEPNKTQSFKTGNSGQMSRDYASSDDVEFATAIAAAVFAINSLQEAGSQNQNKMSEDLKTSSTMIKSRKEDSTIRLPDPGSNKDAKEDTQSPGEASMKKPEGLYGRMPSLKRIPTFGTPSTKPEHEVDTLRQSTSQRPGNAETMADVWEKAEMAKLQRWYERKILNLLSWEKHMREKSRRRVETTEVLPQFLL
ncbi:hypothetical protein HHK36_030113 [Tetracentron sinense]|uniref:Remorin C-terminal domain-containing protein n=1 Tax=Tetracentron sinense TaxID=13715 RepID=A0A834YCW5_TETSI|nr:hypothetical protein HHK36_030113 [Tetracentron sinense]